MIILNLLLITIVGELYFITKILYEVFYESYKRHENEHFKKFNEALMSSVKNYENLK